MNRNDQFTRCTELLQDSLDLLLRIEGKKGRTSLSEQMAENLDCVIYLLSELKDTEDFGLGLGGSDDD